MSEIFWDVSIKFLNTLKEGVIARNEEDEWRGNLTYSLLYLKEFLNDHDLDVKDASWFVDSCNSIIADNKEFRVIEKLSIVDNNIVCGK